MNTITNENNQYPLMPINQTFLDVFDTFMNTEQRNKIRANNVRQYTEGIIDLLLKDKITAHLKPTELYEGLSWKKKLKIIEDEYDSDIARNIRKIFEVGREGSHFKGTVNNENLELIINKAIHIVEDIFVKYFLEPSHQFGSENIFTIFSMLPLHNRIYILENVSTHYVNQHIIDRLSLAYAKSGQIGKCKELLKTSLEKQNIDEFFYNYQIKKINTLLTNVNRLYELNSDYNSGSEYTKALVVGDQLVVGFPTSINIFETEKAIREFNYWFESEKEKYPEFINLFLYLMKTDEREYI